MAKIVSLSNIAYQELKMIKKEGESFSDVVLRLVAAKKISLDKIFGKWPGTTRELDNISKMIEEDRKKFKLHEVKF